MPPKTKALAGPENATLRRRLMRDGRAVQGELGVAPFAAVFHAAQSTSWTQQMMNTIIVAPREAGMEVRTRADPLPAHAGGHAAGSSFFSSLEGSASSAPSRHAGNAGLDARKKFAGSAEETAGPMPQARSRHSVAGVEAAHQLRLRAPGPGSSSNWPDADLAGVIVEPHGAAPEPPKKLRRLLPGASPGPDPPAALSRTASPRLGQRSALWEKVNTNTGGLLDEALDLFTV